MYRQMINFIELMVVSLMALVATSISMLTWYQVVGMFFAAVFMLFIGIANKQDIILEKLEKLENRA